jgi:hypothetical protein
MPGKVKTPEVESLANAGTATGIETAIADLISWRCKIARTPEGFGTGDLAIGKSAIRDGGPIVPRVYRNAHGRTVPVTGHILEMSICHGDFRSLHPPRGASG